MFIVWESPRVGCITLNSSSAIGNPGDLIAMYKVDLIAMYDPLANLIVIYNPPLDLIAMYNPPVDLIAMYNPPVDLIAMYNPPIDRIAMYNLPVFKFGRVITRAPRRFQTSFRIHSTQNDEI